MTFKNSTNYGTNRNGGAVVRRGEVPLRNPKDWNAGERKTRIRLRKIKKKVLRT